LSMARNGQEFNLALSIFLKAVESLGVIR
jgi:hypothetical protein